MEKLRARLLRAATNLHQAIFRATNGRVTGRVAGMPVVMLTTTGRKSGKPYTTMLTSPIQDGDQIVLVASYGGSPRHPIWFLNLRDHPAVEVVMRGRAGPMRARVASAAERAALWPRVVQAYQGYAAYQQKTTREIPLVIVAP